MKYYLIGLLLLGVAFFSACKKDKICLSSDMEFKETAIEDAASINTIIIDFDVVNTGSKEYSYKDEETDKVIFEVILTTEEGKTYEERKLLSVDPSLPAGDTMHTDVWVEYAAGETYKSYELKLSCE